ncbi:hypothetical protein AVEN_202035-1, partial [Araneus ventricosus]
MPSLGYRPVDPLDKMTLSTYRRPSHAPVPDAIKVTEPVEWAWE